MTRAMDQTTTGIFWCAPLLLTIAGWRGVAETTQLCAGEPQRGMVERRMSCCRSTMCRFKDGTCGRWRAASVLAEPRAKPLECIVC